jgi:hypothetical protein
MHEEISKEKIQKVKKRQTMGSQKGCELKEF